MQLDLPTETAKVLCQRQFGTVAAQDGETGVDSPTNCVEFNELGADLLVGSNLDEVEPVDRNFLASNACHVPVPENVCATSNQGLDSSNVGDRGREENTVDVLSLASE